MKGASRRQDGTSGLVSLCIALLALTAAQVIVSFGMRQMLWSAAPLAVLRNFMIHDLTVIAGFAAAGLALAVMTSRSRKASLIVATLAWGLGLAHLGLLAINTTAIYWIRAPLTLAWIETADLGMSETPWVMARSVVTPPVVAGFLGALLLPVALFNLARLLPARLRALSPWALGLVTLGCVVVVATGRPARPDQWRDAVSSPASELWISLQQSEFRRLMESAGDGMTGDYALRPPAPAAAGSPPPRPDILVVVLESVGARAVWDNLARLPTIARLARQGTIFPNASVAAASSTRSMFALVYSRYPRLSFKTEPYAITSGYPEPFLLSLRKGGYRTLFAQGGDFAFQSTDRMLRSTDIGPLEDYRTIRCDARVDHSTGRAQQLVWMSDRCTYGAVETWFVQQQGARAAIVWPVSTHFPYDFDSDMAAPPGSRAAYLDALENSDRLLGAMLDRLAERGIRPVVVILGDHGEAFGEHGLVFHGQTIFKEETGIPLILSGPGVPAGKVDDRLAQIHDIAPTLTDLARVARPCGWQGLSLLGEARRKRAYLMAYKRHPIVGYREGTAKFVFDLRAEAITRYDLAADPGERLPKPVTGREAERVKAAIAGWARYNDGLYNRAGSPCAVPAPG